jgi:TRAP transporter TAXI family solute receptor
MFIRLYLVILTIGLASVLSFASKPVDAQQLNIGTNPVGSIYYAAGATLAKTLAGHIKTTVQPHAGSSIVLSLVDNGEVQLGLAAMNEAQFAYHGKKPFLPAPKVRLISTMFPLFGGMIVRNSSPIRTVGDLKGKKLAGEFKAQLTVLQLNGALLAGAGLTWKDVKVTAVPNIINGSQLLVENRIDAIYFAVGPAKLREIDATIQGGVRFLPIIGTPEGLKRMTTHTPGTFARQLPKGVSPALKANTLLQGFENYLIASSDMTDSMVNKLVRTLYDLEAGIKKSAPFFRQFSRKNMATENATIPYHKAAVKAYKDLGLWSPALDGAQATLLTK